MLTGEFRRGVQALKEFNFTYDILIFPDQLKFTEQFLRNFPSQKFVIDHIAKPDIREKKMEEWKMGIKELAKFPNLHCKISGLVTEADLKNWKQEDFIPYIDIVVESFGIDRVMYGSDWPVCLLGGSYQQSLNIVKNYFSSFTENEQNKFFGANAVEFYNLK